MGEASAPCIWDGLEILDILRYHVSPALWYNSDARSCRLVCRSWSEAFPLERVQIGPSASESKSDIRTHILSTVCTLSISDSSSSSLEWIRDAVAQNRNLRSLSFEQLAGVPAAETLVHVLRCNLPRLRQLEIGSSYEIAPEIVSMLASALAETRSPITRLDISNLKALTLLENALPKTLRRLHIGTYPHTNELIEQFIKCNQTVTSLKISRLYHASVEEDAILAQRLAGALASNTTITKLDFGGIDLKNGNELFAALRTNKTLRHLRLGWVVVEAQHVTTIVDCLCQNATLQSLSLSLESWDENALGRLFEHNKSLKKIHIDTENPSDLSNMFPGLAKNSTLRKIKFSRVDSHFIERLSECLISTLGTEFVRLEKIEISYSSMDETAASKLADAVGGLTNLRILDLFVVDAGPSCAESFARMIETSKSLEMLGLYGCKPGDEGLIRICEAVKKSASLVEIALGGEAHSESAVLAVHDMISTYKRLEFLDFSGTDIPLRFKQLFSDAVLQNPNMYRCEVCFRPDENSPEGDSESLDLKHELTKQYW
eukprot:TRINITY_DN2626_c0_g2_i1.p1 TRINITY_DN2626_c0_g2~~TRINITY_DN2626_c0_g2_i1.p1  ORF type:complete len:546 (-),score=77.28 TRINITY_DN2626_c0_g2_i1:95-1732(-)